jgi:hypothetical protein
MSTKSGNTGSRLFDLAQPTLYYGVHVASEDLITTAERRVDAMRKRLGVERLHANRLGQGRLVEIASDVIALRSELCLEFDE